MYTIRYQKLKRQTDGALVPASAYTVDEYETLTDFIEGLVELSQFRKRGLKYRMMETVETDDGIAVRLDWASTTPTE